ncbi:MAG: hypothetical protein QHH06_14755 [Clostridiales bacterium]|nr:PAS domain-containing protein [Eubacteriales bacterium]MDH7567700.1 hypothetical protein [Clostridiales bacterium]
MICAIDHVCTSLLGYKRSDLIGLNLASIIDTNSTPVSLQEVFSRVREGGSENRRLDFIKEDGTTAHTQVRFESSIYPTASLWAWR